ncbi:CDP-alcohol phosphatidyltransferase family protein [Halonotius terrestris]|uniref:CDP-alcohol phosphatidyltransferase family protein n=1 Tax=Halonotius terrestris TaxID=2487750 RepID=A0A8J8TB31_9EURY|nr:CDP-alcohol phosphatidyltransferase family protein [Halonotius terrestris]TQQ80013.1 CDP-alcohol phosphatidyltransferase family protein [Halonotius terrestris]
MTLDKLRPVAEKGLTPFVTAADKVGLTPNSVSVISLGVAVAAAAAFVVADPLFYVVGGVLVFANGWLDLIDGALARRQDVASDAGDLLDHVIDRYADLTIIGGLAAGVESFALGFLAVTGVLMTSYLGTQIQAVGLGRAYGGLVGRADRLVLMGLAGFVAAGYSAPLVAGFGVIELLLVFFAVIGHITAFQRFWGAWGDL